jgi:hypothetical protein
MEYHIDYLQKLVSQGGPEVEDYYELDAWLLEVSEQFKNGDLTDGHIAELRTALGDAKSLETIQGFAYIIIQFRFRFGIKIAKDAFLFPKIILFSPG